MLKYSNEMDVDINKIFDILEQIRNGIARWCFSQSQKEKEEYKNSK